VAQCINILTSGLNGALPYGQSDRFDGDKFHVLLLGIEPQVLGHPARSVVTVLTDVNVRNQREPY